MLIDAARSCLMIVDVQERLAPVMADPRQVILNCSILLRAAQRLGVPAIVTEQYPKGIGPTVADLRPYVPNGAVVEKMAFGAGTEPAVVDMVKAVGRPQLVIAGIEAHICVAQTALSFQAQGYEIAVVADACSSRRVANAEAAFRRLQGHGIDIVPTESALFEWLGRAGTPEFKELSALIK